MLTIDTVIAELQKLRKEHGDIQIRCDAGQKLPYAWPAESIKVWGLAGSDKKSAVIVGPKDG